MSGKKLCRACQQKDSNSALFEGIDLGQQALANDFIKGATEWERWPLKVMVCNCCGLGQLSVVVPAERLYRHYSYSTPGSAALRAHVMRQALDHLKAGQTVLEVASNNGLALGIYQEMGCRVVGVEPSREQAEEANGKGLPTMNVFWGVEVAEHLTYLQPDLIVARHVLAHVDDWRDFFKACGLVAKRDTTLLIEVPWVVELLDGGRWDTIYHEHLSYITVQSIIHAVSGTGWHLNAVEMYPEMHGGSVGLVLGRKSDHQQSVNDALREEERVWPHYEETWKHLRWDATTRMMDLVERLEDLGGDCAAYGAAAKGSVLLQFCKIRKNLVQYVVDTTPAKWGCLMPGTDIPVISPAEWRKLEPPGSMLILPWNHEVAIRNSEPGYQGNWFII